MRTPKPWFRAFDGWWYVQLAGTQRKLAKGEGSEAEAYQAYYRLMAGEFGVVESGKTLSVKQVFDLFLDYAQTLASYQWYKDFLQDAAESFGHLPLTDLKPLHVTKWSSRESWNDTTRNKAIGVVQAAINYCKKQGIIAINPVHGMAKPTPSSRDRILLPEERDQITAAIKDKAFADFFYALTESGCRPGEVGKVSPEMTDLAEGTWTFQKHKTAKKTKKVRVVYLTAGLKALTERLLKDAKPGRPLFLNTRGKPWTRNAVRNRFRQLRRKLPNLEGVVAYTVRHSYATDALENGVPDATVAELLGHKGTAMLHTYYSKLSKKREHLRNAAEQARRKKA